MLSTSTTLTALERYLKSHGMDIGPAVYLVLTWKRLLTFWGPLFSDLKPQSAALTRNCNTPLCRQSKCSFLDNLDDLVARLCKCRLDVRVKGVVVLLHEAGAHVAHLPSLEGPQADQKRLAVRGASTKHSTCEPQSGMMMRRSAT